MGMGVKGEGVGEGEEEGEEEVDLQQSAQCYFGVFFGFFLFFHTCIYGILFWLLWASVAVAVKETVDPSNWFHTAWIYVGLFNKRQATTELYVRVCVLHYYCIN